MAREKSKSKPGDNVAKVGLALCVLGGTLMLVGLESLTARSYILLECTRGRDCFLTQAGWFSREVTHFREPALLGAKVWEDRDGRRGTPLGTFSPVVLVNEQGQHSYYPLWYLSTRTRQKAEADAEQVVAWKAASDAAPLRMENDNRATMARHVGSLCGAALIPISLGLFLIRRAWWRPRSTPAPKPRVRKQRGKRWR